MIPLPYLPAPVRVLELELAEPLPRLTGCENFQALRILVRARGRPLGWITLEHPGAEVAPGTLHAAITRQLAGAVIRRAVALELEPAAEPAARPPITVVVCTRDRTTSLERCLASLRALEYPAYEILVIDNAPTTDATARLVATLAPPVRYIREDRPGLDWARNRGIREAGHGIIAFTDDDVRVDRRWLHAIAEGFADPATMLVTGLIAPAELDTPAQVTFEYAYGGMDKGPHGWRMVRALGPRVLLGVHHLGAGANMAFRREIFERVGLFDPALDVGTPANGGGDLDMFFRVAASGATASYRPDALVWHSHRRELTRLKRQLRDNGRSFGVYLITRWLAGDRDGRGVPRMAVVRYAVFIWIGWMAGRLVRRFRAREALSLPLQLEEIRGLLEAPFASVATRLAAKRIAREHGGR
jgi:glycosyltransferase involved in cell wall biosynthesis